MKNLGLIAVIIAAPISGQNEPARLVMSETGPYSIVETSEWRQYTNKTYAGQVRHTVKASIMPKPADQNAKNALLYQGNFFVFEDTIKSGQKTAQAVDAIVPVSFQINENGSIKIDNDQGFPTLRGFPTFPSQQVMPGAKWRAPGARAVDPLNSGQPAVIPFTADYEYKGKEIYKGILVHRIDATYSTQYQNTPTSPQDFTRVQGSHKVFILIRVDDGLPLLINDSLDETYSWADGTTRQFKGFTLTFGARIVPMDRVEVINSLGNTLKIEKLPDPKVNPPPIPAPAAPPAPVPRPAPPPRVVEPLGPALDPVTVILSEADDQPLRDKNTINTAGLQDIDMATVPEGIRLTIKDIRFAPDSADFLPTEKTRLDLLAEALKQIPDRSFLVEGHTAATGRPAGEMELSIERAKRMVDELANRGIGPERFIYKGWGGTKPIGDNATNPGRAQNRRVEITILE